MAGFVLSYKNIILENGLEFPTSSMNNLGLTVRSRAGVQTAAGRVAVGVERNKEAEILAMQPLPAELIEIQVFAHFLGEN